MVHTVAEHSTQFISSGGDNVDLDILPHTQNPSGTPPHDLPRTRTLGSPETSLWSSTSSA